jgi:cytochrome b involved in lipid metabolism
LQHNTKTDCWIVVEGGVYDLTDFLGEHPGGKKPLVSVAGKDATEQFMMLHKPSVLKK